MKLSEFNYDLPKELVAHKPVFPKHNSRLMIVKDKIEHKHFYDILDYLEKGDVLVINETKVKKCRLIGKKSTGAPAEIIIIEELGNKKYKSRIKTKNPRKGLKILVDGLTFEIISKEKDIFTIRSDKDIDDLSKIGEFPFPTYIKRNSLKEEEYQPIFAKNKGSVAAPTASLHFTEELLNKIEQKGVKMARITLHIDFGTFLRIAEENVEDHKMHKEYFEVSDRAAETINKGKRVIAVGTTVLRALEAASKNKVTYPKKTETDIYIYPGYKFQSRTELLITNFHLPKSTLLLLVAGFAGKERITKAYKEAIKEKYRFYSLGDAMLLFSKVSSLHPV